MTYQNQWNFAKATVRKIYILKNYDNGYEWKKLTQ